MLELEEFQKQQWKIPWEGQEDLNRPKKQCHSKDMSIDMIEQKRWTQMNRGPRAYGSK